MLAAGCNYPVDAPTATRSLDLAQIEAMVGATLVAEGELTQSAGEDEAGDGIERNAQADTATPAPFEAPALTSTPSSTPLPSATPTPSPTNTNLPSNTPPPSNTPQPSDTPKPTSPPQPTDTQQPAPTECAKFTNGTLSASKPGIQNRVTLTWGSSGGCTPISGTITATYLGESDPYAKHEISGNSGKLVDQPEVRCEGNFTVRYVLTLVDGAGASITVSAETRVTWIC